MKTVVFTIDIEADVEPYAQRSTMGIEEGLPPLFELLDDLDVPADCFFLGSILDRHSWALRKTASLGFGIGSHGWDHQFLCEKPISKQRDEIALATERIHSACGVRPVFFRAANFSISIPALEHLYSLGYILDSSVIPQRVARRWRVWPVYDYRDAPSWPYHPSSRRITQRGDMGILETPVASNRVRPGTPIGASYLNTFGVDKTCREISEHPGDPVVLLTHPWELVDLGKRVEGLPEGYARGCSSDLGPLKELLLRLAKESEFSTLTEVASKWVRDGANR